MKLTKTKAAGLILNFLQGMLIGTGAILPGISGGVLCVAFGIYEPMMEFLVHPVQTFRKHYRLFVPVLLGGAVGFVLLARVVEGFLALSAAAAMALFSGLICGTVPQLMKDAVDKDPKKGWGSFVITLAASFTLFHLLDAGLVGSIEPNFWWYIFCGVVWGTSMVIPGLSSSSILLFLGLYQPMAQGIGRLDPGVLIPLVIGFVATILAASRGVNWLLNRHGAVMSRIILGFVISSVLMITPVSFDSPLQGVLAVACFAVGFLAAYGMDRTKDKQQHQD